jgi:hypothetical protein
MIESRKTAPSLHIEWLCLPLLLLVTSACATQTIEPDQSVQLIQAAGEIPESQLLDVGIQVFDPGLPPEGSVVPDDLFPEVRNAEARYAAIHLKRTMQETGSWGAVRVVPSHVDSIDITVTGRIIETSAKELVVQVLASDSTGRVWVNQKYRGIADGAAFQTDRIGRSEPYQDLYNQISNDLLEARRQLDAGDLREVREVSEIQFAASLSPAPFSDYLKVNRKGRYSVARLPAEGDPMVARVRSIREREYMFIDTLNQHYANFYEQMTEPYDSWRQYSYQEHLALAELRRKARLQKILGALAVIGAMFAEVDSAAEAALRDAAAFGGMAAIQAGMATSQQAKIHIEALRELEASFEAEVEPLVIEIEGQTLRLSGSAETQYTQWRELLRRIYATESGLPVDPNDPGITDPVAADGS